MIVVLMKAVQFGVGWLGKSQPVRCRITRVQRERRLGAPSYPDGLVLQPPNSCSSCSCSTSTYTPSYNYHNVVAQLCQVGAGMLRTLTGPNGSKYQLTLLIRAFCEPPKLRCVPPKYACPSELLQRRPVANQTLELAPTNLRDCPIRHL